MTGPIAAAIMAILTVVSEKVMFSFPVASVKAGIYSPAILSICVPNGSRASVTRFFNLSSCTEKLSVSALSSLRVPAAPAI